jgi:excinuclease ABC subunit C
MIDCFDISNIGESVIVGSCVQYKNKEPHKGGWRLYNIQGNFGQDDFRSMYEVISRRYRTMPLPNLILIDGGIQQVNFALRALQELGLHCHVRGLAKEEEIIIFPVGERFVLNRRLEASKLLIRIRDAAHKFAITQSRHRYKKRYKASELDEILGIGEATKFKLLHVFGSLDVIKKATLEELDSAIGKHRAAIVFKHFH